MSFRIALQTIAIIVLLASSKVMYAEVCPSSSDLIYQKDSGWLLPSSFDSSWYFEKQVSKKLQTTSPANAVVRFEVECNYFYCSNVSCSYYEPGDLSSPILVLRNKSNKSVDWNSIKNYIYYMNPDWEDAVICQTLASNTAVCSWKWQK